MTEFNYKVPSWPIILKGAFFGALIGVLFAGNTFSTSIMIEEGSGFRDMNIGIWLFILILMGFYAGPGAFFLGAVLTPLLQPIAQKFNHRRLFLAVGMGVGLPLGIVNLVIVLLVIDEKSMWEMWSLYAAAIAGGAGLGLGCALAIPFKKREPEANH